MEAPHYSETSVNYYTMHNIPEVSPYLDYIAVNGRMIDELQRIWKEAIEG
jgi:hypothetical protein